jgi:protein-S-isoprenylcysteine O-methyltransferase Ste14
MIRLGVLGFAIFCCAVSLFALIYLAGFVQNQYAFNSIDSGVQIPTREAVVVNLALLALFGLQHSGMARRWFKQFVPKPIERPVYLLATALVLAFLFVKWEPMPNSVWFFQTKWPFHVLALVGAILVFWATIAQGALHFFGIRQALAYVRGVTYLPPAFKAEGLYRLTRHPLMAGAIIYFWATPDMTEGHLLFAVVMTGYVLVAIRWEERDLERAHGDSYRAYRQKVRWLS